MITSLFINAFLGFFNFLVAFLPTGNFSVDVQNGITTFFNQAYAWNSIFPLDTAFTVLKWTVYFWGIIFLWDFSKYILHLIRGN